MEGSEGDGQLELIEPLSPQSTSYKRYTYSLTARYKRIIRKLSRNRLYRPQVRWYGVFTGRRLYRSLWLRSTSNNPYPIWRLVPRWDLEEALAAARGIESPRSYLDHYPPPEKATTLAISR